MAKDRQGLNAEEASSTPGAKVKKSKGTEESSSNAKNKKTDAPKEKGKAHRLRFPNSEQTLSWRSYTRNDQNVSTDWKQCYCPEPSSNQNLFFNQW